MDFWLMYCVMNIFIIQGSVLACMENMTLVFSPDAYVIMTETETGFVAFNRSCSSLNITTQVSIKDLSIARVINTTTYFTAIDDGSNSNGSMYASGGILLEGVFLGKTQLIVSANDSGSDRLIQYSHPVKVIRKTRPLDTVFLVGVSILVAVNVLLFGAVIDLSIVKAHLIKPVGIIIGFVCQFCFLPAISIGVSKAFQLSNDLAFGLLAYGCSPGGGASNIWTVLLNGDLELSISMTLISTITSLGMTTLWLYTAGQTLMDKIGLPWTTIFISIATIVITCLIGILIGRFLPKLAKILKKAVLPVTIVTALFIVGVGTAANLYIFYLAKSWRLVVSCGIIVLSAMFVSGIFSTVCRRPWKVTKTIIIETSIQNVGIAYVILKYSMPEPEADLAASAPVIATCITPGVLGMYLLIMLVEKCVKRLRKNPAEDDKDLSNRSTGNENPAFKEIDEAVTSSSSEESKSVIKS